MPEQPADEIRAIEAAEEEEAVVEPRRHVAAPPRRTPPAHLEHAPAGRAIAGGAGRAEAVLEELAEPAGLSHYLSVLAHTVAVAAPAAAVPPAVAPGELPAATAMPRGEVWRFADLESGEVSDEVVRFRTNLQLTPRTNCVAGTCPA